jgi:broad specificity phosphatase PhoE
MGGMPTNLVLVRHGESEGNVATSLSKKDDDSMFTETFINRHSSTWMLTEKGKQQARIAGKWIKKEIGNIFDRYYVSDYDRAKQTAALLGLLKAQWMVTFYLREREWGDLDVLPFKKRKEKFQENLRRREIDPFYWTPTGGESMANLCLRLETKILDTLHRECDQKNVVLVVHGEVMWAFRYILERLTHPDIMRLEHSDSPYDKIHNGQILHYTRIDPVSGEMAPYLNWMRSVCPNNLLLSSNRWEKIKRKRFSNRELLWEVKRRHLKF